ncbi:MAG: hypothetical protein NW241_20480 [Bacteroidia bacterium]|nr:hypothetical protein [Bacteroidia bacterium]
MKACDTLRSKPFAEYHPNQRKLVLREGGSTYTLENRSNPPEPLMKVQVDGGLIPPDAGKKCDFLVLRCGRNILYLVELKGSDVRKACVQILATLEHPEFRSLLEPDTVLHGRIIPSRTPGPDLRSSEYKRLQTLLKMRSGGLMTKSTPFTEFL